MRRLWIFVIIFPCLTTQNCPSQCECPPRPRGFLVECPAGPESSKITVEVVTGKAVTLLCTGRVLPTNSSSPDHDEYQLLEGLNTGPAETVTFRFCPFPSTSFFNFTSSFGIYDLRNLTFESYRNLSDALQSFHLDGLTNLTRLRLPNNGLTRLPSDLLKSTPNLTLIDLRDNFLEIPEEFFSYTPNLRFLELGKTGISNIEPGIFQNIPNLKFLNLWNNILVNISNDPFDNLKNLESLDLHSSQIVGVSPTLFKNLINVKNINLFGNNFISLPENLFTFNTRLEILRLHDNRNNLTLPNRLLANLTNLKQVFLMKNKLREVPEDLFFGSPSITDLSLSFNYLETLPLGLLAGQRNLKTLDLGYNELKNIPDGFFKDLASLKTLKLPSNRLFKISRNLFAGLYKLEILSVEKNELDVVEFEAFQDQENLLEANFAHNNLSFADYYLPNSPFQSCRKLQRLQLANNSISSVYSDWTSILLELKDLNLSYNKIASLEVPDMKFLSTSIVVDMSYNQIRRITGIIGFEMYPDPDPNQTVPKLILDHNPIECDCQAYQLSLYANFLLRSSVYGTVRLEMDKMDCSNTSFLAGRPFKQVTPGELVCPMPETCPTPCQCFRRPFDKAYVVNCTSSNLHELGAKDFGSLATDPHLNHTELILEDNHLRNLSFKSGPGFDRVTHLFLAGNQLEAVDLRSFSKNLSVLTLDHNQLATLSKGALNQLGNMTSLRLITLHDNPWSCDCHTSEFLSLVQRRYKMIPFLANITCEDGRVLSSLSQGALCPTSMAMLLTCIVIAVASVIIGIAASVYYRFQHEIRVWLYAHRCCLWLVTEDELDKDKRYDAFVSFSHKDEDFVVRELVPRLESHGLTLCLHYRDWVAGEWIPSQIARSVDASRRTLVVLSPNFLDSVWGRLEFRAAHKQALSEGRARVVMLLYGDLPPAEELDPELRTYISVNTYVKWGDPWFWDKLRYALPHAPLPPVKQKKLDQLELMAPVLTPTISATALGAPLTPPSILRPKVDTCPVIC